MIVTIQEIADKFGIPVSELVIKMSADKADSVECKNPKTVILNGLEWMTENLTGHGGREANGNWYYNWYQAMNAAKEVGDGWRLPTEEDFRILCNIESTWDDVLKGRWFGYKVFFKAAGYFNSTSKKIESVSDVGAYWCDSTNPASLVFNVTTVCPLVKCNCWEGVSVRLVRDIK